MGEEPRPLTVEPCHLSLSRTGMRVGAHARALLLGIVLVLSSFQGAAGQVPPDTIRADTLDPGRRDTLQVADSVPADTIFYTLPDPGDGPAGGWPGGVWTWDHEAILSEGALTLVDLVERVPGVVPLRAGDFGTPLGITAFGLGGARVRVFRDGFELLPLGGGSVDLARVGLGGITHVRLERFPAEIRIHLRTYEFGDGRAYSLVEAGTGDLNTNIFRGLFANPTALGGDVALSLERLDSRGPRGDEAGFDQGTWVRYRLHRGDAAGLSVDFRRSASDTEAEEYAAKVTRTDLTLRGTARPLEGLTTEVYWGRSDHKVEDVREAYLGEGGRRSQVGARAALEVGGLFAGAAYRHFGGEDLPGSRLDLSVGGARPAVGGFSAELERAAWAGTTTSARRVRGWTRPVLGLSVFGSWESGTTGARTGPIADVPLPPPTDGEDPPPEEPPAEEEPELPPFRISDRTATRYGVQWAWGGVALSGARLRLETDSLLPIGLAPDRAEPALAGGERTGWEAWGRIPVPIMDGLHLEGSLQQWDEPWTYMPERIYKGALVYHHTFLESGNFELWWSVGVTGRGPMSVRQVIGQETDEEGGVLGPQLASVPFYQSWYGRIQARIVTVRLFIAWDNFTIRRNLQDYPDRLLPQTRAFYGIRWSLWN